METIEQPMYPVSYLYPITDVFDFGGNDAYAPFLPYSIVLDDSKAVFDNDDVYVRRLFNSYLSFADGLYVTSSDRADLEIGDSSFKPFARKFARLLNETYPKYQPQLKGYEGMAGKLMDAIRTTTESKTAIADAPQTSTIASDEGTDELSNLTKSTASSADDGGTAISRLKEIHDAIASVYSEWYHDLEGRIALE